MIELLMTIMVALLPFQRFRYRLTSATPFVLLCLVHSFFLGETTGLTYYGSAMLGSILALGVVLTHSGKDRVVRFLAISCMLSALTNAIGFFLWLGYLPKEIYNTVFLALYAFVVYTLMLGVVSGAASTPTTGGLIDKVADGFFALVERGQKKR